jgi:hypothetical protein
MAPLTPTQAYLTPSQFQPLLLSRANNSTHTSDFLSSGPGMKLGSTISIAVTLLVLLFIVGAGLTYVIFVAYLVF